MTTGYLPKVSLNELLLAIEQLFYELILHPKVPDFTKEKMRGVYREFNLKHLRDIPVNDVYAEIHRLYDNYRTVSELCQPIQLAIPEHLKQITARFFTPIDDPAPSTVTPKAYQPLPLEQARLPQANPTLTLLKPDSPLNAPITPVEPSLPKDDVSIVSPEKIDVRPSDAQIEPISLATLMENTFREIRQDIEQQTRQFVLQSNPPAIPTVVTPTPLTPEQLAIQLVQQVLANQGDLREVLRLVLQAYDQQPTTDTRKALDVLLNAPYTTGYPAHFIVGQYPHLELKPA